MRRKLLLNYLYIFTLSILSQSSSCLTQTANSAVSSSDGQVHGNEERTGVELKQGKERMTNETNLQVQHDQLINTQTRDTVHPVRRKRELRDATGSVQLQGSSKLSSRAGLTSSGRRFKKSDHQMDQNSRKLVSKRNNVKISAAAGEVNFSKDQDKRELNKRQGVTSRSSLTMEKERAKSGQKEVKRSSYSSEATKVMKPKARAIKESDLVSQGSLAKEKLKMRDDGNYAALGGDAEAEKSESEDEQLEDEIDLDDKSAEYEETGDDDEDSEAPAENPGYKENDSRGGEAEEESETPDLVQNSAEDDDSERQEIVKRETEVAEEEYEDIEGQDDTREDASLIDEPSFQQTKMQSEAGLLEKREKEDNRVKRHDIEASENILEKNEAPDQNEAKKQQGKAFENAENVKEDPADNSKRDILQTAIPASLQSGFRFRRENFKRQVASKTPAKDEANGQAYPETKRANEESNDSSKHENQLQQESQTDNRDESNAGEQTNIRLDGKKIGSEDPDIGDGDRKEANVAVETKVELEGHDKSSKRESNRDATDRDDGSYSYYENKLQEQIQHKIDSIKEEIKRDVEEKEKIREIEENNAKYDEIQSGIDEDEDEDNQSLDISNERKSVLKRSVLNEIRSPNMKTERHILRRVKRSETTNARQLQALEGVEKLDSDVLTKAELRHESIRKRSAPVYGAVDKDAPDTSQPLIKRSVNPHRAYLVNEKQKRSPIPTRREVGSTIIIPEQAHVNIEDELPAGLSLDSSLLEDSSSPGKYRSKRSPVRFARRRRASAVVPEGRVAFLGYRPEEDDENDEGSEFDDDGFEDRTSNLQQDKSYANPRVLTHDEYRADEPRDENPASFLFAGVDRNRDEFLVRRKRAGIIRDEKPASLRGGGTLARRQTLAKTKQMQIATMNSRKNPMDLRDKRHAISGLSDAKSDSVASLVGSSQELSPRLAIEYKEAFGGLQSDPGGALARFKRVKRNTLRTVP